MKIALYLGSFNPFHNGHLNAIETAINDFGMDEVVIVPTMQNPWKKEKVHDMDERVDIIWYSLPSEILIYSVIETIEEKLIPPYYSYATLHALKNKYCNDEIFILCGEDTIKSIPNWMNGEKIIQDYDFLIVDRPEDSISSTEIREKVRNNEPIDKMVSENVINLIKKYELIPSPPAFFLVL